MASSIDRNVIRKDSFKENLKTQRKNKTPPIFSWVEFSLTGLCNRVCDFCPRSDPTHFPNLNKHMSVDSYSRVIKDLKKINYKGGFIYSGFSEPILYKYLFEVIKITRTNLPSNRIEMVTNGDHLDLKTLKKAFKSGLTQISVSLYDGPHQIEKFRQFQKELDLSDKQFDLRFRWEKEKKYGINITNRGGAVNMPEFEIKNLDKGLRKKCFYPFYQIMIDYDGAVLLCNHDWYKKLVLGNINFESILKIWDNHIYKKVRGNLAQALRVDSPCNNCDANGTMMGGEYLKEWSDYYE
jgi:radical SAM protein with 4Fe4S-binding SPASM domain